MTAAAADEGSAGTRIGAARPGSVSPAGSRVFIFFMNANMGTLLRMRFSNCPHLCKIRRPALAALKLILLEMKFFSLAFLPTNQMSVV